jgi:hypothetical protein
LENQVRLKDFGTHAQQVSEIVKAAGQEAIACAGRPVQYLNSSRADKEKLARQIAAAEGVVERASLRSHLCGALLGGRHSPQSSN